MRRLLPLLCLLIAAPALAAPKTQKCPAPDFQLAPYRQAGILTNNTDETAIISRMGSQYRRAAIYLGDGYYRCGSVIYPTTNAEAFVLWAGLQEEKLLDPDLRKSVLGKGVPTELVLEAQGERTCTKLDYAGHKPESISLSQRAWSASPWRTCDGIRLGMDYNELVRIHTPPFNVTPGGAYAEIEGFRFSFDVRPLIDVNMAMINDEVRKQYNAEESALKKGFTSSDQKFAYHSLRVNHVEMLLNPAAHGAPVKKPAPKVVKKKKPVEEKTDAAPAASVTPTPAAAPAATTPIPATAAPASVLAPAPQSAPAPTPAPMPPEVPLTAAPQPMPTETAPVLTPASPPVLTPETAPVLTQPTAPVLTQPTAPQLQQPASPLLAPNESAPPAIIFPDEEHGKQP